MKIVIIGGGFGGLNAAKALCNADADITLVDKTNHHLFQPLLYQVATSVLSPADIAEPLRSIFKKQKNCQVLMGEVTGVDKKEQIVTFTMPLRLPYDTLIVATGATHSYFGHNEWEAFAPGLKTLKDALAIRENVLLAFEKAERHHDPEKQQFYLTFVVVGGGPTGVEMAGAIAEMARKDIWREFRAIDARRARIILIEATDRILHTYPNDLSEKARKSLEKLGVEVRLNTRVTDIKIDGLDLGAEHIATPNIIWAAGNSASPLVQSLGAPLDRMGRVIVESDLSIPGYPNIFVIGDCAHVVNPNGQPVPGIAPAAIQAGHYLAKVWNLSKEKRDPFVYVDRGTMATIGRGRAVADVFHLHVSGFLAWLLWGVIHIASLINFRIKMMVLVSWLWNFFSYNRSVRLILDRFR